jgi:hypothetical protein
MMIKPTMAAPAVVAQGPGRGARDLVAEGYLCR